MNDSLNAKLSYLLELIYIKICIFFITVKLVGFKFVMNEMSWIV